jgi:hypothetical protein
MGEAKRKALLCQTEPVALDTFGGRVHVEWDPQAAVTPLGQLPFFIEFLKVSGLLDAWVADCPLEYKSNNASEKRDILVTLLLSILAGHHRYAHITAIRQDGINPALFGVSHLVSEDTARRALLKIEESAGIEWLERHLSKTTKDLLSTPWILDLDTTVKCLYGKQEGAVVGYNPKKRGRPSHSYHSGLMANTRLALRVDVLPGNESAPIHSKRNFWSWFDALAKGDRPTIVRGDIAYGSESFLKEADQRNQPYLTKVKRSPVVKRLVRELFGESEWENAGQGWQGKESVLTLSGWSRARRVVALRREIKDGLLLTKKEKDQTKFMFLDKDKASAGYEYAVLVTSTDFSILTLAQMYRDRADAENNFDELKNQWGWGGFTTHDLARCQLVARMVALVYNWWTLFVRLAQPNKHFEAISSRPLLLHGVATQTRHGGQTRLTITSTHEKRTVIQSILTNLARFLATLKNTAEQLTDNQRWRAIVCRAFAKFINPIPAPTPLLALT